MPWTSETHPVLGPKAATEIESSMSKSNRDDMLGVMTIAIAGSRVCGVDDDDCGSSVSSASIAVLLVMWRKIRGIYGARICNDPLSSSHVLCCLFRLRGSPVPVRRRMRNRPRRTKSGAGHMEVRLLVNCVDIERRRRSGDEGNPSGAEADLASRKRSPGMEPRLSTVAIKVLSYLKLQACSKEWLLMERLASNQAYPSTIEKINLDSGMVINRNAAAAGCHISLAGILSATSPGPGLISFPRTRMGELTKEQREDELTAKQRMARKDLVPNSSLVQLCEAEGVK